jgi:hypothetical protein
MEAAKAQNWAVEPQGDKLYSSMDVVLTIFLLAAGCFLARKIHRHS